MAVVFSCLLVGGLSACITGILASKLWYINRYIRWFLYATSFSVFTSAISVLLISIFVLRPAWQPLATYYNISIPAISTKTETVLKQDMFFHVFLSAFFEFLLSLQSVKIASEGVKNTRATLQTSSPPHTLGRQDEKINCMKLPDYSDVVKELCRLQKNALIADGDVLGKNIVSSLYADSDQRLPRSETEKEYKERMEKFLSAQYENEPSIMKTDLP